MAQINFDPIMLLTEQQKKQLSEHVFSQMKESINKIEFTKIKVDLNRLINDELSAINNDDGFINYEDAAKLGSEVVKMLIKEIKSR